MMLARALVLASLAAAGFAPAASATTLKTTSGATIASGSAFSGSLKAGTVAHIEGGTAGDIDCSASTLGGTIGTNPNTPSVTGSLTSMTFSSCTDTIPFVTVSCMTTNVSSTSPKTVTWTYAAFGSTTAVSGVEMTVCFSSGSTCVYRPTTDPATAQHDSTTTPPNNEYKFNAVALSKVGGTFAFCPDPSTWTATYVFTSGGSAITIAP